MEDRLKQLGVLVGVSLWINLSIHAQDCTHLWEQLDSRPYKAKLFIDSNNTYWRLRFKLPEGKKTALRLQGQFPHSRYTSYNVYDQTTMDSSDFIADRNIQPEAGNLNPFLHGVNRNIVNRNYSVWLVPHGMKSAFADKTNVLELPEFLASSRDQEHYIEIWHRIYFPDRDSDGNGGVPLPTIESFNAESLEGTECPTFGALTPPELSIPNLPPRPTQGDIYFYHSRGSAIYSLPDNHYLVSRLTRSKSHVYIFRFKPPTFSDTYGGGGAFNALTQVRYWSICVAGLDGTTGECLPDSKVRIAHDGFVNIVIAGEEMRSEVESLGFNFISRGNFFIPVVLYRNLLSAGDFLGDVTQVPLWYSQPLKPAGLARPSAAQNYIGEYAPKGAFCSIRQFFKNYCEVSVSF